jgi:two-component system, cell cycle sensor histidine kinase and response regulator CckA
MPESWSIGRPIHLLFVHDQPSVTDEWLRVLTEAGLNIRSEVVATADAFVRRVADREFDAVIADFTAAGWNGLAPLELLQRADKKLPFILLTGVLHEEQASGLMQKGITDWVERDRIARLPVTVQRAVEFAWARKRCDDLDEELRRAQRVEAVGRLATGIAHDFSNIVTIIHGHTGLLRAEPHLSPSMQDSLQQVARATERAGKLTHQLVTLGRNGVPNFRSVDLNEVLADMSTLLQRTIGEDIELEFCYDSNLPPVYADPHSIEQCVLSIAVNAREAMPSGGQLLVSTSTVDLTRANVSHHPEARQGQFVCLTVVDSGAGEQSVSRLFNPLWTARSSGNGFEFGLGAVNSIVQRHQGWVEVQGQIGHGTTLRIYFPVDKNVIVRRLSAPSTQMLGHTVLVVEDEAPVRAIMRTMLERRGFKVLEAASGIDALAVWHQQHDTIQLLLTDLVLPSGISGQELAEQFTAQKPGLRVLYTSGYSAGAANNGVALDHEHAFLEKPFDGAKLIEAVYRCLEGVSAAQ